MPIAHHYSPEIFQLVPMSTLGKQHFEAHPIWSEHYDYDERDEIVAWGVEAEWLASELERVHTGNDHCAYPILQPHPLPSRMRLYIRARITTAAGQELDGYVMNENAFVMCVFVDEKEFSFSRHSSLSDLNQKDLESLAAALGCPTESVFPLTYETDFLGPDDVLIAGTFSPGM